MATPRRSTHARKARVVPLKKHTMPRPKRPVRKRKPRPVHPMLRGRALRGRKLR